MTTKGPPGQRWDWSRLRPRDTSVAGLLYWLLGFVLAPALGVYMVILGSTDLPNAWDAAHGHGQLGTLHVTSVSCSFTRLGGHRCTGLYGDYTSDDGATSVRDAFLDDRPAHAKAGSDVRVRYLGGRRPPVVYSANGSHDWLVIAGLMVASLITLAIWAPTVYALGHAQYLPWMERPWKKPQVIRDERASGKTGHRRRRGRH